MARLPYPTKNIDTGCIHIDVPSLFQGSDGRTVDISDCHGLHIVCCNI